MNIYPINEGSKLKNFNKKPIRSLEQIFKAYQNRKGVKLTLVMLNKLRCHTHFEFSPNQIIWSSLLIQSHILNDKQCRSRSVGFFRSQLIWIYTVCKGRIYPGSAGQGLKHLQAAAKQAVWSWQSLFADETFPIVLYNFVSFMKSQGYTYCSWENFDGNFTFGLYGKKEDWINLKKNKASIAFVC